MLDQCKTLMLALECHKCAIKDICNYTTVSGASAKTHAGFWKPYQGLVEVSLCQLRQAGMRVGMGRLGDIGMKQDWPWYLWLHPNTHS